MANLGRNAPRDREGVFVETLWVREIDSKLTASLRGALATKQSIYHPYRCEMDCFAEPVIGRAFARPVG
ncbi:MAG: hypothetical protein V4517_15030, partial [Pseudomonadota bacterium]